MKAAGMNAAAALFQFHKGTIRTQVFYMMYALVFLSFNSIKVRLEQRKKTRIMANQPSFNSIKVRLERVHQGIFGAIGAVSIP